MQKSFRAMAQRQVNAHNNFAETIQRIGQCDSATAHLVTQYYLTNKIAKLDLGIGHITVKHGAFLDTDVVRRAIAGRDYTHIARVPLKPETWLRLTRLADKQGRSAAHIIRELIDKHLRQSK